MYKHWKNRGQPLDMVFFTTTVLDFVPVFRRTDLSDLMAEFIIGCARLHEASLHAFVVMPDHIHFLLRLPAYMDASTFCKRLKTYSAKQILPQLGEAQRRKFDQQRGLNQRQFWQVSFRSRVIEAPWRYRVAVRYIHWNPVKRGLCALPEEFRWSSAWMGEAGHWNHEEGLTSVCFPADETPAPPNRLLGYR